MTMNCPFVCPLCRNPRMWSGGCFYCHGTSTGRREDWAFPGDRYELDGGHFVKVCGPRRACSVEENAAGFAALRVILDA